METNGKTTHKSDTVDGHRSVEHITTSAHGTVDRLASGAHRVVDRAAVVAGSAAETLVEKRERISVVSTELTEDVRGYVQSNPLTSIGIAAAIGFIFSRLVGGR